MKTIKCDRCGYTDAAVGNFTRILIKKVPDVSPYENKTVDEIIQMKRQYEQIAGMANYKFNYERELFYDLCYRCSNRLNNFLSTPDSSGAGENQGKEDRLSTDKAEGSD